jgi:CYTH domain-containing protein
VKYARIERERRFLLDGLPDLPGARVLRITDRYLDGTRLRLRRVEEDGRDAVLKLGQKIPTEAGIAHTTMYLDGDEQGVLLRLPAHELHKTRHLLDGWAVDVHPSGLVLAETETDAEPPFGYVREVTDEVEFTGGALAGAR